MKFNVPIYVQKQPVDADKTPLYEVAPLFVSGFSVRNEMLSRAMRTLANEIRKSLNKAAGLNETKTLVSWSFAPALEDRCYDIPIRLRRRVAQCKFMLVSFKALDRKIAFTPSVLDVWFEVERGESVQERAETVLSRHFREKEKDKDSDVRPEDCGISGKSFVTSVEIEINMPAVSGERKKLKDLFAEIFSGEKMSGAEELEEVGDCLDWLYPDDLDRAVLRDREVEELTSLVSSGDKRPVLLLGPRKAGKTAIIHEYVYRQVGKSKKPFSSNKKLWHISPQRLISGMMVVGQWEDRVLAIIKEAKTREHTLYFDDLLGLYLAGISSDSTLNVAQVFKPHLEKQEFRLLAELTPEAFRVLQERDRGLADMFHVIRVPEMSRRETLRVVITSIRQYEMRTGCRFDLDALPAIIDLQARYVHDAAFPGKAASFAQRLSERQRNDNVKRSHVIDEFHAVSGLSIAFMDGREKLESNEIESGLRRGVIGQESAVKALTHAISRAKARLNDTEKPLGVFLFVGPTGVGKTQCAKAAAAYLYGNEDRVVRFDMNEFSDAISASRLVGTFMEPEGLLTSRIMRTPFCVLLLDEIEKAHHNVFDLLLQVTGEGRLTDAHGRTADFRNCFIILTSNLGAREARSRMGFLEAEHPEDAVYINAARNFFRPEFFNRIDLVVPFASLTRAQIESIATRLIRDVMGRHGLRQRKSALQIDRYAMERLVEEGYHPQLGARALKRVIEQQLAQPVATCLASLPPGAPAVITAYAGPENIAVISRGLVNEDPLPKPAVFFRDPEEIFSAVQRFLVRAEHAKNAMEPDVPVVAGKIFPEHHCYYAVSEQFNYIRSLSKKLERRIAFLKRPQSIRIIGARAGRKGSDKDWKGWRGGPEGTLLDNMLSAHSMKEALDNIISEEPADQDEVQRDAVSLITECALLDAMLRNARLESVLLCGFAGDGAGCSFMRLLKNFYTSLLSGIWGLHFEDACEFAEEKDSGGGQQDSSVPNFGGWVIEGVGVQEIMKTESGTSILSSGEEMVVSVLKAVPLSAPGDAEEALRGEAAAREEWMRNLATGQSKAADDPYLCGKVTRLFEPGGAVIDFRAGAASKSPAVEISARRMVLGTLPLPVELELPR